MNKIVAFDPHNCCLQAATLNCLLKGKMEHLDPHINQIRDLFLHTNYFEGTKNRPTTNLDAAYIKSKYGVIENHPLTLRFSSTENLVDAAIKHTQPKDISTARKDETHIPDFCYVITFEFNGSQKRGHAISITKKGNVYTLQDLEHSLHEAQSKLKEATEKQVNDLKRMLETTKDMQQINHYIRRTLRHYAYLKHQVKFSYLGINLTRKYALNLDTFKKLLTDYFTKQAAQFERKDGTVQLLEFPSSKLSSAL